MKNFIYEAFFLGFDAILFVAGLSFLLVINHIYQSTEESVNKSLNIKTNITTTYEDCSDIRLTKISGTSVVNEILSYDDSFDITINGTLMNNIVTPTREPFLLYIKKYDQSLLYRYISETNSYLKECVLNNEGKIVRINYVLIAD